MKLAGETGIMCDPVYTGKAVNGLLNELKTNPQRFKGNRILFIHTGTNNNRRCVVALFLALKLEIQSLKLHWNLSERATTF